MSSYVPADLRRLVESRASQVCEYCLIHESDTYLGCHVDHIISEKHGGETEEGNLCYACALCNRSKGSDIGSIVEGEAFVRFYNPRTDAWLEHFQIKDTIIEPRTAIGQATAQILGFNGADRLLEREALIQVGRYPSPEARSLMRQDKI